MVKRAAKKTQLTSAATIKSNMRQHGFTLIEILVVLVIISVIVSMAAINTGNDPRIKELSAEAQRLRFVLEDLSEQAIFRNTDIGFVANKSEISFYEQTLLTPKDENDPNSVDVYSWQLSKQKVSNPFKLTQEAMSLSLSVDGLSVVLPFSGTQDDKKIEPHFFAYSSGEQDVTLFEISIDDLERITTVKGMGVGRFYTGVKDDQ
jgi:type II secretion system protein H